MRDADRDGECGGDCKEATARENGHNALREWQRKNRFQRLTTTGIHKTSLTPKLFKQWKEKSPDLLVHKQQRKKKVQGNSVEELKAYIMQKGENIRKRLQETIKENPHGISNLFHGAATNLQTPPPPPPPLAVQAQTTPVKTRQFGGEGEQDDSSNVTRNIARQLDDEAVVNMQGDFDLGDVCSDPQTFDDFDWNDWLD